MSSLLLIAGRNDAGTLVLKSPGIGLWRRAPQKGSLVVSGQVLGTLEVLGREIELIVPEGVRGIAIELLKANPNRIAEYGQALLSLSEDMGEQALVQQSKEEAKGNDSALVLRSQSSGRFYLRPSPDKPPFVSIGDIIETGHIVYLLEVMKTFSRIAYEGDNLPARVKVIDIVPADGDDLEPGQVVLKFEEI